MDMQPSHLTLPQLELDKSSFSRSTSLSSFASTETACDGPLPLELEPHLCQLPRTPNISPVESPTLNIPAPLLEKDLQLQPSETFIEYQASLILDDGSVEEFSSTTQHMFDDFKSSPGLGKLLNTCNNTTVLRIAHWWFLHAGMKLDLLFKQAKSSHFAEEVNHALLCQALADLAKALWVLRKTRQLCSVSSGPEESDKNVLPALRLHLLVRIRRMIWAVLQHGFLNLLSELSFALKDIDLAICIRYPPSSAGIGALISGTHTYGAEIIRDIPMSIVFPLGDTGDVFHYGGMHGELFLTDISDYQQFGAPVILSIVRGREERGLSVIFGTQDGLLNIQLSSSRENSVSWNNVTWVDSLTTLRIKLHSGFKIQLRLNVLDYQILKDKHDYYNQTLGIFQQSTNETLIFEASVKFADYRTTSQSARHIFPTGPIADCEVRLFEKTSQWASTTGLRKAHCGFRIAVLTPISFKNLSVLSSEHVPQHSLEIDLPTGRNANPAILCMKLDHSDPDLTLELTFGGQQARDSMIAYLTGSRMHKDEAVLAQILLVSARFSSGFTASNPAQSINDIDWQEMRVIGKQPSSPEGNSHVERSRQVQCESLRILIDSPQGRITDRVNIGIGELKIRRNVIASGHELHVLRQPQEDLSFTVFNGTQSASKPNNEDRQADLHTLYAQSSIRTYSFPTLSELHLFQSTITGFSVIFDSMATSFSISRRRMLISIHKEWSSPHTRIQILRRGKVVQLVAYFEGFRHLKALNFALKSTDIFEKSMKAGKLLLKFADAKFSLPPISNEVDMGYETGFVCLDLLEYPGEHNNIHIGFANEAELEKLLQCLPAPVKSK